MCHWRCGALTKSFQNAPTAEFINKRRSDHQIPLQWCEMLALVFIPIYSTAHLFWTFSPLSLALSLWYSVRGLRQLALSLRIALQQFILVWRKRGRKRMTERTRRPFFPLWSVFSFGRHTLPHFLHSTIGFSSALGFFLFCFAWMWCYWYLHNMQDFFS